MADVTRIDPTNLTLQSYEPQDENLISQFDVTTALTGSSYIEFFIYDNNQTLLYSTLNYTSYNVLADGQAAGNNEISQFNILPGNDTEDQGFDQGEYVAYYNFLTKQIGDPNTNLFIQEISSDRTEIRLDSNILSNLDIVEQTNNFIQVRDESTYFVDFYLNFGSNDLIIANNIQLENATTNDPTILIKLYEPLPAQFGLKNELWVVTTLNEPEAFNVNFPPQPIEFVDFTQIAGPNYNIPIKDQVNNSTQNLSYNDLISSNSTSSLDQLNSLMDSSSLSISVDYTEFSDFIHFSSAQTRLENFYYKVKLIEGYSASIANLTNVTSSTTSTTLLQGKISEITKNFDRYEYFLYYDSGSTYSWPKTTTKPPYLLATTGSTSVLNWFGSVNEQSSNYGGLILSASDYDNANQDELKKAIPEYLREDSSNQPYDLFIDMVAQYYDNVWLYTKDVTQKYNADNRLDFGVSKDLVSDAIKDFGVKLYQNNFSKDDLYTAFLGLTPNGALFPFPEITSSLPAPSGFEYVNTLISASNDIIPLDDVNKSLYKRIYHNIPYLLKSKGTIAGVRALITSYGIPDTILRISEFGGKDKVDANDYDYYFNKFNYAYNSTGSNYILTKWGLRSEWNSPNNIPSTVQFRFKAEDSPPTSLTQSLWSLHQTGLPTLQTELFLEYTGSGLTSGSYSGSIKDPYYQYANLKFVPDTTTPSNSASIYLPFFNGDWWSVMITSGSSNGYEIYTGNKIYNGNDGTSIGYYDSSSILSSGNWNSSIRTSRFTYTTTNYPGLSGSIQEIRYYTPVISESVFKDYIMNPLSIEGNSINSSPNELAFRAALGSELDTTTTTSIHPKVTGSWIITQSFSTGNTSDYTLSGTTTYRTNTEYYFLDQFPAGIKNRITDKIRYEDNVIPSGDTLSAFRRVTQATEASASYTENINYLEVAFSPQNEINDDIVSQLGYFTIGDYIGDPRQRSSSLDYYPDLNNLSKEYFEKYIKNYDLVDFVRLIKFFDNSLFAMIKDFIPARTSLASGIVIKQHLLERNKYPQPQVSYSDELLTGSIDIGDIEGGPGGMLNPYNSPPREIIMEFSATSSLLPVSSASLFEPFASLTASLNSTLRGELGQFNIPANSSVPSGVIEMYDGERFFIKIKKNQTSTNTFVEWKITNPNDTSKFGFYSFGGVDFTAPAINFLPPTLTRYTGSQVIGGSNYEGNQIVWDENNDLLSLNYLPTETLYTSDVNTQFWDETFTNLSGSVTKTNDSQYEFYNGEFSGSTMLITDGELNSECDEFKNVSTTSVPYYVRFYFNSGGDPDGFDADKNIWLSNNNLPLDGYLSIYYNNQPPTKPIADPVGTLYLKIPKIDNNGVDQSLNLESLTQIIIPSSTNVAYQFETVTEKPTFYLYKTIPNTSTPDVSTFGKLSYNLTGSIDITTNYYSLQSGIKNTTLIPIISSSGEDYGFYNQPQGKYTFNTYIQKDLYIYSTISSSISGAKARIGLYRDNVNNTLSTQIETLSITSLLPLGNNNLTLEYNMTSSLPGDIYFLGISGNTLSVPPTTCSFSAGTTFFITSSAATATSSIDTVLEPYFSRDFSRAFDCQPLLNNTQGERPNPFLQDLDYQTSQTVPVNYQAVVSESATKATVPESNYTQLSNTNIRYNGSVIQSEKINQWTKNDNIGTYGKTSPIEVDDTVIYEYEWAGGTTPEILGWGAYKMGKLLNVKTVDDVRTINPGVGLTNQLQISRWPFTTNRGGFTRNLNISQSVSEYYYTLNGNNPTNSNITIFPYETTIGESSPTTTKVLTPDFGVPTISNFILTSSNARYGNITSGSDFLYLTSSVDISRVKLSNGAYATGEIVSPTLFESSPSESLGPQLNDGDRWFVTLYNSLEVPINNNDLTPYNTGNSGSLNGEYTNPLGYKGVFEIYGARFDGGPPDIVSLIIGPTNFTEDRIIGGNDLGALIWKARAAGDNEFVIVQSEVGSNGPGCFVDQYTTDGIVQNLEQITRNFGSNKQ